MGFLDSLVNSAGSNLGNKITGGYSFTQKEKVDVVGRSIIANNEARAEIKKAKELAELDQKINRDTSRNQDIQEIRDIVFTDSSEETVRIMQALSSYAQTVDLTDYSDSLGETLVKVIIEKMEFGIIKLKNMELTDEVAFFQSKKDNLKAKIEDYSRKAYQFKVDNGDIEEPDELDILEAKINETTFSPSQGDLLDIIQDLISSGNKIKFDHKNEVEIGKALIEKIDFGMLKLSSAGRTNEIAFFQPKFDALKAKIETADQNLSRSFADKTVDTVKEKINTAKDTFNGLVGIFKKK